MDNFSPQVGISIRAVVALVVLGLIAGTLLTVAGTTVLTMK
jgi:hypothetical protein